MCAFVHDCAHQKLRQQLSSAMMLDLVVVGNVVETTDFQALCASKMSERKHANLVTPLRKNFSVVNSKSIQRTRREPRARRIEHAALAAVCVCDGQCGPPTRTESAVAADASALADLALLTILSVRCSGRHGVFFRKSCPRSFSWCVLVPFGRCSLLLSLKAIDLPRWPASVDDLSSSFACAAFLFFSPFLSSALTLRVHLLHLRGVLAFPRRMRPFRAFVAFDVIFPLQGFVDSLLRQSLSSLVHVSLSNTFCSCELLDHLMFRVANCQVCSGSGVSRHFLANVELQLQPFKK